jgi:hypothetical protein
MNWATRGSRLPVQQACRDETRFHVTRHGGRSEHLCERDLCHRASCRRCRPSCALGESGFQDGERDVESFAALLPRVPRVGDSHCGSVGLRLRVGLADLAESVQVLWSRLPDEEPRQSIVRLGHTKAGVVQVISSRELPIELVVHERDRVVVDHSPQHVLTVPETLIAIRCLLNEKRGSPQYD